MINMKPKLIAHRGYSYKETENTLSAIKLALKKDFYGIELDIHLTKDNVFVINHDFDTKRLGNKNLVIKDVNYNDLKDVKLLDINNKNNYIHNIIKLEEALNLINKHNKYSVIEIKPLFNEKEITKFYNLIKKYKNIIVISFHINNLLMLRKLDKNIKLQFLSSKLNYKTFDKCIKYNIDLDLNYKLINKDTLKYFKENNFLINVWTVNDINILNKLIKYQVNYITTDKFYKI